MNVGTSHKIPLPYCSCSIKPDSQEDNRFFLTSDINDCLPLEVLPANRQYGQCRGIQLLPPHSRRTSGGFPHMPEVLQGGCADYNPDVALNIQGTEFRQEWMAFFYKLCIARDYYGEIPLPKQTHSIADKDHGQQKVYQDGTLPLGTNHRHPFASNYYNNKNNSNNPLQSISVLFTRFT